MMMTMMTLMVVAMVTVIVMVKVMLVLMAAGFWRVVMRWQPWGLVMQALKMEQTEQICC